MPKRMPLIVLSLVILAAWTAGVVTAFRRAHAGHIALRQALSRGVPTGRHALDHLEAAALHGGLDAARSVSAMQVLVAHGRPETALETLTTLVSRRPEDGALRLLLGDWLSAEKRFADAEQHFLMCLGHPAPDAGVGEEEVLLRLARNAAAAGWNGKVLNYYTQFLRKQPHSARIREEYARFLMRINDADLALEQFTTLLKGDPQHPAYHLGRGQAARAAERHAEAVAESSWVLERDPDNRDARVIRGQSELALGRAVTDLPTIERLAAERPQDRELAALLARALLREGKAHPALLILRRLQPDDLTDIHVSQGYAEALLAFGKVAPEDVHSLRNMAAMLATWGPEERAPALLVAVGRGLGLAGEKGRAAWCLEQALATAPDDRKVRADLVGLLLEMGRRDDAARHSRLLRGQP